MSKKGVAKVWLDETRGVLIARTPFSSQFISHIKAQIPRDSRRWNPETKNWEVEMEYVDQLLSILRVCYDEVLEPNVSPIVAPSSSDLFPFLTKDDIKAIYRLLAKRYHPDSTKTDGSMMVKINDWFKRFNKN